MSANNQFKLSESLQSAIGTRIGNALMDKIERKYKLRSSSLIDSVSKRASEVFKRLNALKTFINPDSPVTFHSVYVTPDIGNKDIQFSADIDSLSNSNSRIIISATAGAGKSMVLRHLYLCACQSNTFLPILIELRGLNNYSGSLVDYIIKETFGDAYVKYGDELMNALKDSRIILLLDAYDELNEQRFRSMQKEIAEISTSYPNWTIILSTRPMQDPVSWSEFTKVLIKPLTLEKAVDIISKTPADSELKKKFIIELKSKLFQSNAQFITIPLLLILMLLMYSRNADLPRKRHLFYEQAFECLFHRHDALKDGYSRALHSGLALDDFRNLCAAISLISHLQGQSSFTEQSIRTLIKSAMTVCEMSCNVDKIMHDLLSSVCIFLHDGSYYSYTHRSFQEYFAACHVVKMPRKVDRMKILSRIQPGGAHDEFLINLYQINRPIFEEEWLRIKLRHLSKKYHTIFGINDIETRLCELGVALYHDFQAIEEYNPHTLKMELAIFGRFQNDDLFNFGSILQSIMGDYEIDPVRNSSNDRIVNQFIDFYGMNKAIESIQFADNKQLMIEVLQSKYYVNFINLIPELLNVIEVRAKSRQDGVGILLGDQ